MPDFTTEPRAWWVKRKSKRIRRDHERAVETAKQIRRELQLPEHPHLT